MSEDLFFSPKTMQDFNQHSDRYDEGVMIQRSTASIGRTFIGWDGNHSIKSDYRKSDYDYFRGNGLPKNRRELLRTCAEAYDRVGIVKNVIDLMSDFASKGIKFKHEIPAVEKFYNSWFSLVKGADRTERFVSCILKLGVVIVYKTYGKVNRVTTSDMKKVTASITNDGYLETSNFKANHIPVKYTFLNPENVEALGEDIGYSLGNPIYVMSLLNNHKDVINSYLVNKPAKEVLENLTKNLPEDLRQGILKRTNYIPLDQDKLSVFHYKKDDWNNWGKPISFSILDDLEVYQKLKLADISALDGAVSNIRMWKIGRLTDNPSTTIIPTKAALDKFRDYLSNNVGGGTFDVVCGPELDFKESNTNVHQFLGKGKYEPTIDAIYEGLGISPSLRNGSSNAEFGLKALIEKITYARGKVEEFWNNEIDIVHKALGFSKKPIIEFEYQFLTDESAQKQLLINLADRDIISHQTLRDIFKIPSKIEDARLNREVKKRGKKSPQKAGPYHNSEKNHDLAKIALTGGTVTPSEVGLELLEKRQGEKSRQDVLFEQSKQMQESGSSVTKQTGIPGRPKNVIETKKRDYSNASVYVWAQSAHKNIHDFLLNGLDKIYGKKNLRSLNNEEVEDFEKLKCAVLFNTKPFTEINEKTIATALEQPFKQDVYNNIKTLAEQMKTEFNRDLTMEEQRHIYTLFYCSEN